MDRSLEFNCKKVYVDTFNQRKFTGSAEVHQFDFTSCQVYMTIWLTFLASSSDNQHQWGLWLVYKERRMYFG